MAVGGIPGFGETEQRILAEVAAAVDTLNFGHASQVATDALNRGMRHPALFNARGLALHAMGRVREALEEFNRALVYKPNDSTILNAIALCQAALGRTGEAVKTLDKALVANPNQSQTHCRRGQFLTSLGNHDAAEADFVRAIELDPNYADALANLAAMLARKREGDRARALAERALKLVPNEPMAIYALAIVEIAEKRFVEAEKRLRGLISEGKLSVQQRASLLGQLGDALDGQKHYAEAFAIYTQENEELRQHGVRQIALGRAAEAARHLTAYFEATSPERWKSVDDGGPNVDWPAEHIFLLGFIRSGTTLLEQVLASNPQIVALEEKGLLNIPSENYLTSNEGLDALADLRGPALAREREDYWGRVRSKDVEVKGKIFVDKQPLNTVKLPLISRLFPRAKVLVALRDPRDVVFSCYRRHFALNATMYEFLSLEDAAHFYASVMQLAELCRQKLPLNVFEHRYEDMVEDFDGRVHAMCDFIGVPWAETMREFNKNAPYVDLRSPSATQVRRPLYSEGVGQWRRYAKELAPILPILKPWVEKYGYPAD